MLVSKQLFNSFHNHFDKKHAEHKKKSKQVIKKTTIKKFSWTKFLVRL